MDVWMPVLNGVQATRELAAVVPSARVLIVSNERDPAIVHAAFTAGARGYALKSLAPIDLLKAIEAIVRGDLFIGRGLAGGESDDG
jgi:DNA-binding NarL/FixJ family response regulator